MLKTVHTYPITQYLVLTLSLAPDYRPRCPRHADSPQCNGRRARISNYRGDWYVPHSKEASSCNAHTAVAPQACSQRGQDM